MSYVRQPDGNLLRISGHVFEHCNFVEMEAVADGDVPTLGHALMCRVLPDHVCAHGYRLDEEYHRRDGDGCIVVAVQALDSHESRELRGLGVRDLPTRLRNTLEALEVGTQVEVLLDDGRVVATTTRSTPRPVGGRERGGRMVGQDYLVQLVGFASGFNLARCRTPGWVWTTRLDG